MGAKRNESSRPNIQRISPELRTLMKSFIDRATEEYSDQIMSIVLFGSGATGEWTKGRSDVDIIVVIKDNARKRSIEKRLLTVLLELDSQLGLGLRDTCSTYRKTKNPIINLILKMEHSLTFGCPLYVFSRDQLDFQQGRIRDDKIEIVTSVFDSLAIFVFKLKQDGITLYGEDFIEKLRFTPSRKEKVKTLMAPVWILATSLVTLPFEKQFSVKHAIKATKWACEDVLFALDGTVPTTSTLPDTLRHRFADCASIDFQHLETALNLKQDWVRLRPSITSKSAAKYVLGTVLFISILYLYALRKFSSKARQ